MKKKLKTGKPKNLATFEQYQFPANSKNMNMQQNERTSTYGT
jgi:hypothetical protein